MRNQFAAGAIAAATLLVAACSSGSSSKPAISVTAASNPSSAGTATVLAGTRVALPRNWKPFDAGADAFVCAFPGTPTRKVLADGTIQYGLQTSDALYQAETGSLPGLDRVNPEVAFDSILKAQVDRVSGTVAAQTAVSLDGHPARDARVTSGSKDREFTTFVRTTLVGTRIYVLALTSLTANATRNEANFHTFTDSFHVTS